MHDARAVRGGETGQDRVHDRDGLRDGEALLLAHELTQGDAGEVLHDQVGELSVLTLVEHVDHMRVGETGGSPGLLDEPALEGGVVAEVRVHHLEGDAPLEAHVGRHVDGRHAAAGDAGSHAVPTVDKPPDERVGLRSVHRSSL